MNLLGTSRKLPCPAHPTRCFPTNEPTSNAVPHDPIPADLSQSRISQNARSFLRLQTLLGFLLNLLQLLRQRHVEAAEDVAADLVLEVADGQFVAGGELAFED